MGFSVLLGISLNSEKVYLIYLPAGLIFFGVGSLLLRGVKQRL